MHFLTSVIILMPYHSVFINCTEHAGDLEVMVELFDLIGKLSVRDEFCQKVLELGGVACILSALQNSISNKVLILNCVLSCVYRRFKI